MPKVHKVVSARKPIPSAGVKPGDTYYWWKFRFGGKRVSKIYPKRSQLTQSDFLGQMYDLQERIDELNVESYIDDPESLSTDLQDIADEIRALGDEQEEKRNNMPESLQDGDTGTLLQDRADGCNTWADDLESACEDFPTPEDFEDECEDEFRRELRQRDGVFATDPKAPERELTEEEKTTLAGRVDAKYREEIRAALESAIDAAKSADPGIE